MKRILCLCITFLLLLSFFGCQSPTGDNICRIYFLDVGQGDCILLRCEAGDILIDAGTESSQELLCLRLGQLGVRKLALAVFTHPDEDHIGGADGVLRQFGASEVWLSGAPMENESAQMLLRAADECGSLIREVSYGTSAEYGQLWISVLAPFADVSEGGNESSIVLKLQYGEISALFSGDAGVELESDLVRRYGSTQLSCDLYKVGHHGSNTSTSWSFLTAMSPSYAVISCGIGNSYGHPMGEVLARLEAVGALVLRTDLLGEIVLETDGSSLYMID